MPGGEIAGTAAAVPAAVRGGVERVADRSSSGIGFDDVTVAYGGLVVLDSLTLTVNPGEIVALIGPSGSGKTTALRAVAGFVRPARGRITIGTRDVTNVPPHARNIAYGLACRGWTAAAQRGRVDEMLAVVNLADHAGYYPHQLSGGQQQRVALARALAPRPQVLLLDEPLSALDAKVREDLRAEIKSLQSALGVTTIMVTHDQHEAMEIADRIVVMNRGVIEQVGAPRQLYDEPANRFVADFIGRMNFWSNGADGSVLGVRPEHLHLAADADAGDRAWRGRIERIVFLGSITRVLVAGDDRRCTVELGGSRPDLQVGQSVYVHADAAAVHHLAGPGA